MTAAEPLVSVDRLSKHFVEGGLGRRATVRAVDDVSFTIAPGQTLGLVGESGSGKTTLGRTLLRLLEPSGGRVVIDGVDLTALAPRALRPFRRRAQIVFQDPFGSLDPRMTIGEILAEPLAIHGLARTTRERRRAVGELLERVQLRADMVDHYPHEFSGGQRQRVGIARALAVRPRFIVADEPLSALDVSIQAQVVNLLVRLQAEEQLTYLFVSHDLRIVAHLSDQVAVMYLGKIVEKAPATRLYAEPRHPYTRALLSAVPTIGPGSRQRILLDGEPPSPVHPPPGCAFHPRCPLYAAKGRPERCHSEPPPLAPLSRDAEHLAACHFAEDG